MPPRPQFAEVSDRARLLGTGKDLLDLLHRLSTQELSILGIGEGRPTVLTSAKGRIVERLFVHRLAEREVLLVGGERRAEAILHHLKRYTFAEETGLTDISAETAGFALIGEGASEAIPDPGPWGARHDDLGGVPATVLGQDGYTSGGRTVVVARADRERARAVLSERATEIGPDALEGWRIAAGFPAAGHELTEDWNPLEAGLWDHVSFTKGCYVGQEVVARLRTYDRVSRRIFRLRFPASPRLPEAGSQVESGGRSVGRLTSIAPAPEGGAIGLAYLKVREQPDGTVRVDGIEAEIVRD